MAMDQAVLARYFIDETQLRQQQSREYVPLGWDSFDEAFGGVPRGAVTEIYGHPSSGKTTFLVSFLARLTSFCGDFCALIDASDAFDPTSAAAAGADLNRLLWVRCHGVEEALKAADLLVHAGGWGIVAMDLGGIAPAQVRKIPMSWWYRFRRAVENTPTAFLVAEREPFVKNCAVMALEFQPSSAVWSGEHKDFKLLRGTDMNITPRKPVRARTDSVCTRVSMSLA